MRIRTTAPDTADIDFLSLTTLEALPALQRFVEECQHIGEHINALDFQIPRATERYSFLWRAYTGSAPTSLASNTFESPEVFEARQEVQDLQDQRKVLMDNAQIARAELNLAQAQLLERFMPDMRQQLGQPLTTLITGIEACLATERLAGQVPGHAPARQAVGSILSYLRDVRALLQEAT